MTIEVKEYHNQIVEMSKMVTLKDGHHMPIHLLNSDKGQIVLGDSICNEESKDYSAEKIRALIKEHNCTSYTFIGEANMWVSKPKTKMSESVFNYLTTTKSGYEMMKQHSEKRDVLIIKTEAINGVNLMTTFDVQRDDNDDIVRLKLMDKDDCDDQLQQMSTRFGGVFSEESDELL